MNDTRSPLWDQVSSNSTKQTQTQTCQCQLVLWSIITASFMCRVRWSMHSPPDICLPQKCCISCYCETPGRHRPTTGRQVFFLFQPQSQISLRIQVCLLVDHSKTLGRWSDMWHWLSGENEPLRDMHAISCHDPGCSFEPQFGGTWGE